MSRSTNAILAEICVHPERDDLRLEYASACEAKDPGYAEYIRTEIDWWSREKGYRGHVRGSEKVEQRIAHPFLDHCYRVEFSRGFVEELTIDPYVFIDRGDKLLDLAPIRSVVFTPKPTPRDQPPSLRSQLVPSAIPEVMACPHLRRVYSIHFQSTRYQSWCLRESDVEAILASPHLDRLLWFSLPTTCALDWPEEFGKRSWERAFERPEFRKMISIGFPCYPGERTKEHDEGYDTIIEATPMPSVGRELERKHGYLPSLHHANLWGDGSLPGIFDEELVLAVLRGELPKFPAGTPVTEEMYELPPPKRRQTLHD